MTGFYLPAAIPAAPAVPPHATAVSTASAGDPTSSLVTAVLTRAMRRLSHLTCCGWIIGPGQGIPIYAISGTFLRRLNRFGHSRGGTCHRSGDWKVHSPGHTRIE